MSDVNFFVFRLFSTYTKNRSLTLDYRLSLGHYWAYIYDYEKKTWLRFNDTSVTESTFEELANDSIGGTSRFCENYASAYCLIYVDSNRRDLFIGDIKVLCFSMNCAKARKWNCASFISSHVCLSLLHAFQLNTVFY